MLATINANRDALFARQHIAYCGNYSSTNDETVSSYIVLNLISNFNSIPICEHENFHVYLEVPYFYDEKLNCTWWKVWLDNIRQDPGNIWDYTNEPDWYGTDETYFNCTVARNLYAVSLHHQHHLPALVCSDPSQLSQLTMKHSGDSPAPAYHSPSPSTAPGS
jgi:hypothetical protein